MGARNSKFAAYISLFIANGTKVHSCYRKLIGSRYRSIHFSSMTLNGGARGTQFWLRCTNSVGYIRTRSYSLWPSAITLAW